MLTVFYCVLNYSRVKKGQNFNFLVLVRIKKPCKGADGHRRQHARLVADYLQSQSQGCSLGQCGDFQNFRRSVTLTFDRVKVISTYTIHVGQPACLTIWQPHAQPKYGHLNIVKYRHSAKYEFCDSFPRRKFQNWAEISCRPSPILSLPTSTFELHTKMAEETGLEKCNFWNFTSSVTLTLTLFHTLHMWSRSTHTPN